MNKHKEKELIELSYKMRRRFLDIFTNLGFGHLTTAFSETEILITLLMEVMNYNPKDSKSDKLYLSKGHGAGMLFPIWEEMGILMKGEIDSIVRLGGDFSKIKTLFYPGFEFYGGSLGIGMGMAAGHALGAKLNKEEYFVYCVLGDAECYEGSVWEAVVFAGHNKLNNLIVVVDRNGLGCSDFTEHMCGLEPFAEKWRDCNWEVFETNGHSYLSLINTFETIKNFNYDKPICLIANTKKGKGLKYTIDKPLMHGYMPKGEEIARAYAELDKEVGK